MLRDVLELSGLTNAGCVLKLLGYPSSSLSLLALSLMALTPQDIAQRAGEEARNILGAVPGLAADGAAQYIKIGTPPSLIPNVGLGLARQACRRYADNPDGLPGSVAAGFERVCRPYLDDIGYGAPPALEKPFDGGQCPGTRYTFEWTRSQAGTTLSPGIFDLVGPLSLVKEGDTSGTAVCPPGQSFSQILMKGANNTSVTLISGCDVKAVVTAVYPTFGGPNNCGSPAPIIRPPVPPVGAPGPVREPYNPSPDVDIDIDLTIGPGGDINFNIGTGPITIDPFGGDDGGGDGGDNPGIDQPGTAPSSGLPPGDIGEPAEPVGTGTNGRAAGCAPPNSVLVGIKINILMAPAFGSEYDPLVRRGVCYAYMGTIGNLALDPSGVALRDGQMLFAPLDNLTCWEVRANTGYILRVTPYYRALEPLEV